MYVLFYLRAVHFEYCDAYYPIFVYNWMIKPNKSQGYKSLEYTYPYTQIKVRPRKEEIMQKTLLSWLNEAVRQYRKMSNAMQDMV